jgi:NAD(P)-dependent dehydrogenase (short-subunit alcohol dehydrogenase family)
MTTFTVRDIPDMTGKTAIVTGASSGIGQATARALAAHGARVVFAVRNTEKGKAAAAAAHGGTEVRELDLASLDSIRAFAAGWDGPVDLLINNAGVSQPSLSRTVDGFEAKFGTNHLGHFALTNLLLEHITGRVVTVASQAERFASLDFGDLNWERRPYAPSRAYNDSKLANLLFTAELQRRLTAAGSRVLANAAHPGLVATNIYHHDGPRRPADHAWAVAIRLLA